MDQEDFQTEVLKRFEQMDQRFEQMDQRFDRLDEKIDEVQSQLHSLAANIVTLPTLKRELRERSAGEMAHG